MAFTVSGTSKEPAHSQPNTSRTLCVGQQPPWGKTFSQLSESGCRPYQGSACGHLTDDSSYSKCTFLSGPSGASWE